MAKKSDAKKRKAARKKLHNWLVRIAISVTVIVFLAFMIIPLFLEPRVVS